MTAQNGNNSQNAPTVADVKAQIAEADFEAVARVLDLFEHHAAGGAWSDSAKRNTRAVIHDRLRQLDEFSFDQWEFHADAGIIDKSGGTLLDEHRKNQARRDRIDKGIPPPPTAAELSSPVGMVKQFLGCLPIFIGLGIAVALGRACTG